MDPEVPNVQPPTGTPPLHGVCRELLQTKGTVRAKIVAAGVGPSITHELGLGQGRLAPLRKTRLGACRTYTSGLNMAKAMGGLGYLGFTPNTGKQRVLDRSCEPDRSIYHCTIT